MVSLGHPYAEVMRQAAGRDGVWVPPFGSTEPGLPDLYLDDTHLNADGHRIAAEQILDLLTSPSGPDLPDRGADARVEPESSLFRYAGPPPSQSFWQGSDAAVRSEPSRGRTSS